MTSHSRNNVSADCVNVPKNGRLRNHSRLFSTVKGPSLEEFKSHCARKIASVDYPLASSFESNVPVYHLSDFQSSSRNELAALQDELYHILRFGPGVFVTKGLYSNERLLTRVNEVYAGIIRQEKATKTNSGDHFAASGKNDRIWNSFGKHCLADPSSFLEYYSNPLLALICESWLGPAYRITAQVNVVKPGGQAQMPHRDYHLGFQTESACAAFPRGVQVASQFLTLQGAVAQADMPLESGPTRLLPFSQSFDEGYMAYRRPEFVEYFLDNYVSLPLEQGDGLFFNPALFHGAGENETNDFERSASLLQISSAFGKPMESISTIPLVSACWNHLAQIYAEEGENAKLRAAVAAIGEGYPFPTNLDNIPPRTDGMAPESEQDMLLQALRKGENKDEVLAALRRRYEQSLA